MANNVPSSDVSKLSLGQCVVYVGVVGETPSTDVGTVENVTVHMASEWMSVYSGDPSILKEKYPNGNSAFVEATLLEWNLDRFREAIGSADGSSVSLEFGGFDSATKYSLHLQHATPVGNTINIYIWKVIGSGNLDINFQELHKFPVKFDALVAETDWENSSLEGLGKLVNIEFIE